MSFFCLCVIQGHPPSEASSTATGGSDESTSSSPGQEEDEDEDDGDLLVESEDEIETQPITEVDAPVRRKSSIPVTPPPLYSWKEVRIRKTQGSFPSTKDTNFDL